MSDSSIPNESILLETRLVNSGWWRRPDVQADIRGTTIAFEVQVSTEFISMIVMREWFYERSDSAAILWVLPSFDPDQINSSQRDILTRNNDHLFVLSPDMIERSLKARSLSLECWLHMPEIGEDRTLVHRWERRVVGLEDIQFVNGHAQVIDLKSIENDLKQQLALLPALSAPTTVPEYAESGSSVGPSLARVIPQVDAFYRNWSNLYERIADLPDHWIREELVSSEFSDRQSRFIAGIWLKSRGLDLCLVGCDRAAIKALVSADMNELLWQNQSWKWVTNLVANSHSKWLRPYHKLMKEGKHADYDYKRHSRQDSRLLSALAQARSQPPLSQHQKAFLAVLCPRLMLPAPGRVPLTDLQGNGLSYQVVNVGLTPRSVNLFSPEFPYYAQVGSDIEKEHLLNSLQRDLDKAVSHSLNLGYWISMPNLQTANVSTAGFLHLGKGFEEGLVNRLTDQVGELNANVRRFF